MACFRGNVSVEGRGVGLERPSALEKDDDEFDAYRKRMMLAYRFRPNPLVSFHCNLFLNISMYIFHVGPWEFSFYFLYILSSLPKYTWYYAHFLPVFIPRIIQGDLIIDAEKWKRVQGIKNQCIRISWKMTIDALKWKCMFMTRHSWNCWVYKRMHIDWRSLCYFWTKQKLKFVLSKLSSLINLSYCEKHLCHIKIKYKNLVREENIYVLM